MRKHVKPAHPQAAIPDPVRGGDLPPEGLTVEWSVHWARLQQRGDIIVKDVDEGGAKTKSPAAKTPKAPRAAPAGRRAKAKTKSDAAAPVSTGEAPDESGPVVEGPEMDAPAALGAPEPAIT